MNTKMINNIAKKLFFGSLLSAVIFLSASDKATAANNLRNDSSIQANMAEKVLVRYLGNNEDGLFFNVRYNNETGKYFTVVIKDENGETLYEAYFDDKSFDKKFLFPRVDDQQVSLVSITVASGNDSFVQSFNVITKSNSYKGAVVSKN